MAIAPLKPATRSSIPGAKASASVIYQNDPQYSADMVLDGDPETRWATPEGTNNPGCRSTSPRKPPSTASTSRRLTPDIPAA